MKQYLNMAHHVLTNGRMRGDRTGTGTIGVFGHQERFDLSNNTLPLATTKKVFTRGLIEELLWMLKGSTNNEELTALNVHIWDGWALTQKDFEYTNEERILLLREKTKDFPLDDIHLSLTLGFETWNDVIDHASILSNDAILSNLFFQFAIPVHRTSNFQVGDLGKIYGNLWRSWNGKILSIPDKIAMYDLDDNEEAQLVLTSQNGIKYEAIDQISDLIKGLKEKPFSRRHVVTAWDPTVLPNESKTPHQNVLDGRAALASCHCLFQFYVEELTLSERQEIAHSYNIAPDRILEITERVKFYDEQNIPKYRLSCQLYQRSADLALGVPFNIASYSLLTMMVAQCVGMVPGEFIHTFGDLHIYSNHVEGMKEQLTCEPYPLPTVTLNPTITNIFDFTIDDITINNYQSHPAIKFDVSI